MKIQWFWATKQVELSPKITFKSKINLKYMLFDED